MTNQGLASIAVRREKQSGRKDIYLKYANSAGVKTLVTILHHSDELDDGTIGSAIKHLMDITNKAMDEAGCRNVNGQRDFADAIYFDFTMPAKDKIALLQSCETDQTDKIREIQGREEL